MSCNLNEHSFIDYKEIEVPTGKFRATKMVDLSTLQWGQRLPIPEDPNIYNNHLIMYCTKCGDVVIKKIDDVTNKDSE